MYDTRRLKLVRVDPRVILAMMNRSRFEFLDLPNWPEIPDGTDVLAMYPDQSRRCVVFVVTHPTFPEVADNEEIPLAFDAELTRESFVRVKSEFNKADEIGEMCRKLY